MTKQVSPLRQRMIDDMTIRNMSPNTQKVYTYAIANFSTFHARSPDKLGVEDVREYRLHLMARGLSATEFLRRPSTVSRLGPVITRHRRNLFLVRRIQNGSVEPLACH